MNIEKYQQLKEKLQNNNFERSYGVIDKILYAFSFLGNTASIIFAYFFVNTLLWNATDEFPFKSLLVPAISVVSLTSFELLKRFLFKQTTVNILVNKKTTKETVATVILSLILVTGSFYLALNGAKNMADKTKHIDNKVELNLNSKSDSITKVYDAKITKLEKDKSTWIQMVTEGTRNSRLRSEYNTLINQTNLDIKNLEKEKDEKIKSFEERLANKSQVQKAEVGENITSFIIICIFIESIILIGVWFSAYYDFRSFKEFDDKVSSDDNYRKFMIYDSLLNVAFNNGKLKRGEDFDSFTKFKEICKIKGLSVSDKTIKDFHTIIKYLKISNTVGNRRIAEKTYDEAKEVLVEYYNV